MATAALRAPALAPPPAHAGNDTRLLSLGEQMRAANAAAVAVLDTDEAAFIAADKVTRAIVAEIVKCRATTFAGLRVKAAALTWCLTGDLFDIDNRFNTTDLKLVQSIIDDLTESNHVPH